MKKQKKTKKTKSVKAQSKAINELQKKSPTKLAQKFILPELSKGKKTVLHVGCGKKDGHGLHRRFKSDKWYEVRLDIESIVEPDIVADMTDMYMIGDNQFDAIWSSHNLEHVFAHQVIIALKEFYRVLKIGGFLLLAVPDIQKVAEAMVEKGLESPLYVSASGPIYAIDVLYGFRPSLQQGVTSMAHRTGFSAHSLANYLKLAGFLDITVQRSGYNLIAVGNKLAQKTEKNSKEKIVGEDVNAMMAKRDELDVKPNQWLGLGNKG